MLCLIKNAFRSHAPRLSAELIRQFRRVQTWLNSLEIDDVASAHFLCRIIPAQCPFETEITLFNRKVGYIPPLCKLNPFYDEVVKLRFRALCYLAEHGEDIGLYC